MAKRSAGTNMTRSEKISGGILLLAYFVALPLVSEPLFDFLQKALKTTISADVRNAVYYYVLLALTLLALGEYFLRAARAFFDHTWSVLGTIVLGLIAFYGLNELTWRVLRLFIGEQVNLNDQAILSQLGTVPHSTVLIVVILAPIVEEAVFRGYIFGNLREYNRWAAYLFSAGLFALLHVWQFTAGGHNWKYLLLAVQYMAPGLVMAWTFERAETLWGSILLHGIVNGLSVLSVL